jgi:hypothetical protein
MRVLTKTIKAAFEQGVSKTVGNTRTDGKSVFLFGNEIIRKEMGKVFFSLAGWNTPTTRERISGITGVGVSTCKGTAMVNGRVIDDNEWYQVNGW